VIVAEIMFSMNWLMFPCLAYVSRKYRVLAITLGTAAQTTSTPGVVYSDTFQSVMVSNRFWRDDNTAKEKTKMNRLIPCGSHCLTVQRNTQECNMFAFNAAASKCIISGAPIYESDLVGSGGQLVYVRLAQNKR
jgi:hypothetical protein